jgi:restriction endonuclease S subunit
MVENFKLPLLSISEQIAITTILSDIDIELTTLESRRQKILNLKNINLICQVLILLCRGVRTANA